MKSIKLWSILFLFFPSSLWAQQGEAYLKGKVTELTADGTVFPLVGANVYWLGTTQGMATNPNGEFSLQRLPSLSEIVVSFVGFKTDTVNVKEANTITIQLTPLALSEVEVFYQQKTTEVSYIDPIKTENIGEEELLKAACCNLSESFETNPSIDVSFTDAVTGTRQIQMLGLAGPYTQIMQENLPSIRGLSAIYGLTFVPGTWIESIQLNKGTGSVVNGYESIAGQINVELRKPETAERMNLNTYANEMGRLEFNANFAKKLNSKWSTAVLLHGKNNTSKWDRNEDGFLDNPLGQNFIGLNRWKYVGENGLRVQFGVKGTYIDSEGGQLENRSNNLTERWQMQLDIKRLEGWAKIGKVYEAMPWKSIGLQMTAGTHQQNSYFGRNNYNATQNTAYANLIYQSIIGNTNHNIKTGATFQYDEYLETLNETDFNRTEIVPGAYFEYAYNGNDKFNLVAGFRTDYHNLFGLFFTPRLHMRYALRENTILRLSAGRGQRTANIIAENNGLLASARQLVIRGNTGGNKPYGLDQEIAWNYGLNLMQYFIFAKREAVLSVDFYRTDFQNQIVVDLDQSPQQAVFYNLEGESYSNSLQVQIDYPLFERFDVRLAYRWFDIKTTFGEQLLQKPLVAAHRAFANLAYETKSKWKFDYTVSWQGEKRIPFTGSNPTAFQLAERSPSFVLMNAQVTKVISQGFEVYVGAENLLNFRQENPILSSEQPFGAYFDSSLIWGPIFGRNIYLGIRYRIK